MRKDRLLILGMSLALFASAGHGAGVQPFLQEPPGRPPAREVGEQAELAFGSITSVGVDRFEIKKQDGSTQTVMVDDHTRYREGQQEIQLEDLKPGDRVFARGQTNAKKDLVATNVRRITDEEVRRFQGGGDRAFGEIVSIDKNQLTVRNRMQGERVVVVNEETTYIKQGQPSGLKDLKVGDRILARGKETNGQFVAAQVISGNPQFQPGNRQRRRPRGDYPRDQ